MYLALDEIGQDRERAVLQLSDPMDKWRLIEKTADELGLAGIQLNPELYEQQLGLSLDAMPERMLRYRLSYHLGGVYGLETEEDAVALEGKLQRALRLANKYGLEDVSFHPPGIVPSSDRTAVHSRFRRIVSVWLPSYRAHGIGLTIENHVHERFWLFKDLQGYADFVTGLPGLRALFDVSHNINDGLSMQSVLAALQSVPVAGLHLSDAIAGVEFRSGTHLPVGHGEIDFRPFLTGFVRDANVYGVLEIKGQFREIADSATRLQALLRDLSAVQ